jgi:hypothetical protein
VVSPVQARRSNFVVALVHRSYSVKRFYSSQFVCILEFDCLVLLFWGIILHVDSTQSNVDGIQHFTLYVLVVDQHEMQLKEVEIVEGKAHKPTPVEHQPVEIFRSQ